MSAQKDSDWRSEAGAEYRLRRAQILEEIDELDKKLKDLQSKKNSLRDQLAKVDDAASVFGIPPPEELELDRLARVQSDSPSGRLFKDVALELLEKAHPHPMKAAEIQADCEVLLGRTFHQKTAGMTLYRLAQDGKVRREGHKWFFIPQADDLMA